MQPADAADEVTFGADASSDGSKAASSSGRDLADGARKPAWANAGAGVAVVSGRHDPLLHLLVLQWPHVHAGRSACSWTRADLNITAELLTGLR